MSTATKPRMIVAFEKENLAAHLNHAIAEISVTAIQERGAFTLALSGGSLPGFLASLEDAFEELGVPPHWTKWHIILADERCVSVTSNDSNLKALQENMLSELKGIPVNQIHGINESLLSDAAAVAADYQTTVSSVLEKTGGYLDLAVLGFGPDGHTCSLFPKHALLEEKTLMVASITDSPKPPPSRITLTFRVLNQKTRHVIVCGAGSSKGPILREAFISLAPSQAPYSVPRGAVYEVELEHDPAPYPCAMVVPNIEGYDNTLTWIVDAEAMSAGQSTQSPY